MIDVTQYEWLWYWRKYPEAELTEGGILCQPRTGQAYSVVRMPIYMDQEEWEVLALYICDLHNARLKK